MQTGRVSERSMRERIRISQDVLRKLADMRRAILTGYPMPPNATGPPTLGALSSETLHFQPHLLWGRSLYDVTRQVAADFKAKFESNAPNFAKTKGWFAERRAVRHQSFVTGAHMIFERPDIAREHARRRRDHGRAARYDRALFKLFKHLKRAYAFITEDGENLGGHLMIGTLREKASKAPKDDASKMVDAQTQTSGLLDSFIGSLFGRSATLPGRIQQAQDDAEAARATCIKTRNTRECDAEELKPLFPIPRYS